MRDVPDKRATAPRVIQGRRALLTAAGASVVVYVLTAYSIPWLIGFAVFVPYELWAVRYGTPGAALSHVVWWAYGNPLSVRWWLIGMQGTAFLIWCQWHWLLRWPGLRELWWCVGAALLLGAIGIVVTR